MSRRIEKVVVVGRDAPLWLTALALRRAFGRTGLRVEAVELPSRLSDIDTYVAMPTLAALHGLLGIDEQELIGACAAVYNFGQRFVDWSGPRSNFMHAYDTVGATLNNVAFIDHWVKARRRGLRNRLEDFSLGAVAARQGRFVAHTVESEKLSRASYGYHLDARSYAAVVRARALRSGVVAVSGPVTDAARDGDRITAVMLAGGERLAADLFVDVSAEGALIEAVQGVALTSWRDGLPADRILTASTGPLRPAPGYGQIVATPAGWMGMFALQNRTGVCAAYSSEFATDEEMLALVSERLGHRLLGEPAVASLASGARATPWVGNCIAVGEAAVRLEPLDAAPLQLVQMGLTHLVALFPVESEHLVEAEIYNDLVASHAANIRDFQIAHYKLNQRQGEPFWDRARAMTIPAGLAYKIELFGACGRAALYDDETFQESSWTSIFVGHGLIPRAYDPLADQMSDAEEAEKLQELLRFIGGEVAAMPTVEAQLEVSGPPPSTGLFV